MHNVVTLDNLNNSKIKLKKQQEIISMSKLLVHVCVPVFPILMLLSGKLSVCSLMIRFYSSLASRWAYRYRIQERGEGIELQATCTWGCRGGLYVARCEGGWCGVRVGSVVC